MKCSERCDVEGGAFCAVILFFIPIAFNLPRGITHIVSYSVVIDKLLKKAKGGKPSVSVSFACQSTRNLYHCMVQPILTTIHVLSLSLPLFLSLSLSSISRRASLWCIYPSIYFNWLKSVRILNKINQFTSHMVLMHIECEWREGKDHMIYLPPIKCYVCMLIAASR